MTSRRSTVAGLALYALSAALVLRRYLVDRAGELWQLDLEVYRDGAVNLLRGYPVYDWLTGAPQFLPFTYPPFSAIGAIPLALMPFAAAGWVWSAIQLMLLWVATGIAFRPLLIRCGPWGPLARGAVAAVLVQTLPVSDGFRFGQVNAVVVTLCLVDLAAPPGRWRAAWLPPGSLTGLAAAVKLTPAAFWPHLALARRWGMLTASVGAAAAATLAAAVIAPAASAVFWTDALLDPDRLGPNSGTSNQSLRGALLRVGPADPTVNAVFWLVGVALVGWFGYRLSARLDRAGDQVAVVAVVGMVAVLVSPVSWIHHWHWGIAVVGALLGDGRAHRRVIAATGVLVVLLLPLPWWGGAWPGHGPLVSVAGRVVEQSYTLLAVVSLVLLWRLVLRSASGHLEQAEQGQRREQRAGRSADPADQGQGHPAQQRPTGGGGDT